MSKVRTTIALSEISHQWLRERAPSTGEMAEYLESLLQKERLLEPIESRLRTQTDRLAAILTQEGR